MKTLRLFFPVLIIVFSVIWSEANAQPIRLAVDNYSVSEGLSNSVTNAICQDKYGFIWIGTDDGLNRFDGYNFHKYRNIPKDTSSLAISFVTALYSDHLGRLWVGTHNGLSLYRPASDDFINFLEGLLIEYITEDSAGNIICRSPGMIIKVDGKDFSISNFETFGITDKNIVSVHILHDTSLLLTSSENIVNYSPEYDSALFVFNSENEQFLDNTEPEPDGTSFILTNTRVLKLRIKDTLEVTGEFLLPETKNNESDPICIFLDSEGSLWLATDMNVYRMNKGSIKFQQVDLLVDGELPEKFEIEVFFEDSYGNLWMSDYGNGLLLRPRNKNFFAHYDHNPYNKQSLGHSQVSAFAEDSDGLIWIGTWGGGLSYYNPENQIVERYDFGNEQLNTEVFRGACFDREGRLWLSTHKHGLVSVKTSSNDYQIFRNNPDVPGSLPSDKLYSVFSIRNGEIWSGHANNAGLVRYDPLNGRFDDFQNDTIDGLHLPLNYVRVLMENEDGNLWVGTYGWGIYFVNLKNMDYYQISSTVNPFSDSFLNKDVIYSLLKDKAGLIWIGTMGGGLNVLNTNNHMIWHITEEDGLSNDVVNGILKDDHGNLWISTNKGINRFSIPDFIYSDTLSQEFMESYDFQPHFLYYDINDGLQSDEFKYASCLKSTTGEMYFGGNNGFSVFHPDSIKLNPREPDIVLTGISLYNQLQLADMPGSPVSEYPDDIEKLDLRYNQNFINFDFVALGYNNSRKNQYEYLLEGFDDQWNSVSAPPSATYMNLKPGEYTFRVRASNNDGVWTKESKDLKLFIRPPFWGRIWFQLLGISILLGIIFSFYNRRLQLARVQAIELEDRVKRRTNQLQSANIELEERKNEIEEMAARVHETDQLKLRFFTNISHEFRTPLTLIVGPVEKMLRKNGLDQDIRNPLSIVYRNALRLLRLINELLELRKLDTGKISLRVWKWNMVEFIKGQAALFEFHAERRNISFSVSSTKEEINAWFDRNVLEKVVYNLLSNSFKYTPDGGKIDIHIQCGEGKHSGYTIISVRDNGKGISKEHRELIFERFYQVQKDEDQIPKHGSGIGLAMCKEFVELHKGKIMVDGNKGNGSTFTLLIPDNNSCFSPEQIIPGEDGFKDPEAPSVMEYGYQGDESLLQEETEKPSLPLVLVIDNNKDMLSYVKDILNNSYQIIMASGGIEGLEKARKWIPELIISDIMMSGLDGLELTHQIKNDDATSHIPVILLSARASENDRIQGLKSGADDYITKPFSSRILLAKVRTVINNRKKIMLRYKDDIGFDASSFVQSSPGDNFVIKAVKTLEENLSNEAFNTEEFARTMGLSRAQFYRKISATAGQSPSEFIRSYRMRKAAELLLKGEFNISEVAYHVGFKSASHFTRSFKHVFGQSPTEYISDH